MMNTGTIHIPDKPPREWQEVADEIISGNPPCIIYVLGKIDSGKTTFCHFLLQKLTADSSAAYIDCDPGQSVIGPPATVGLAEYSIKTPHFQNQLLYFIGATSPIGHLLQTLAGIKKLSVKAQSRGLQNVIMDSSGFVLGSVAQEFQFQCIDLLNPHFITAFQQNDELESLLKKFRHREGMQILRLPINEQFESRTFAMRQAYREERFRNYFESARLQYLNLENTGFHGRIPDLSDPRQLVNRLVGLNNSDGFTMVLGIIQKYIPGSGMLPLYAPPVELQGIASLQFGSIFLNLEGKQL